MMPTLAMKISCRESYKANPATTQKGKPNRKRADQPKPQSAAASQWQKRERCDNKKCTRTPIGQANQESAQEWQLKTGLQIQFICGPHELCSKINDKYCTQLRFIQHPASMLFPATLSFL
jgi:hypothetical protein